MKVMSDYLDSEKEETLDVRDLFDFFDSDKDGFISQQELQVRTGTLIALIKYLNLGNLKAGCCENVSRLLTFLSIDFLIK